MVVASSRRGIRPPGRMSCRARPLSRIARPASRGASWPTAAWPAPGTSVRRPRISRCSRPSGCPALVRAFPLPERPSRPGAAHARSGSSCAPARGPRPRPLSTRATTALPLRSQSGPVERGGLPLLDPAARIFRFARRAAPPRAHDSTCSSPPLHRAATTQERALRIAARVERGSGGEGRGRPPSSRIRQELHPSGPAAQVGCPRRVSAVADARRP